MSKKKKERAIGRQLWGSEAGSNRASSSWFAHLIPLIGVCFGRSLCSLTTVTGSPSEAPAFGGADVFFVLFFLPRRITSAWCTNNRFTYFLFWIARLTITYCIDLQSCMHPCMLQLQSNDVMMGRRYWQMGNQQRCPRKRNQKGGICLLWWSHGFFFQTGGKF